MSTAARFSERCPQCRRDVLLELEDLALVVHPVVGRPAVPSGYRWQCPRCLTRFGVVAGPATLLLLEASGVTKIAGPEDPPIESVIVRVTNPLEEANQ